MWGERKEEREIRMRLGNALDAMPSNWNFFFFEFLNFIFYTAGSY